MPFISNGIYNFDDTVYSSKEMLNTSCIELSDAFITAITGNSTSDLNIFSQVNKYSQYTDSYLWLGYTGFIYKNHLYQSYISSSSNKFTYIDFDLATKTVTKKTLTTTTSNNAVIDDTIDILKRIGLLDYKLKVLEDNKTCLEFLWVKNELPK